MMSIAPALLLSMPQLLDPNFHKTVVLLCEHAEEGAFGLIVNRPSEITAAEAVHLEPEV
jgi:putative transcriptional regulator